MTEPHLWRSELVESSVRASSPHESVAQEDAGLLFAGYAAHELRTPLATQRTLLELALGDPDTTAADWREIGEEVFDACLQQESLLDACLALARSGFGTDQCDLVDLEILVGALLQSQGTVRVHLRARLGSAPVVGDARLLERLVDNLIGNACIHNTPDGWVELTTTRDQTTSLLTVENSGPRILERDVPRLFEPFRQYAPSPLSSGLGLGLAIAKAVADAHDAVISAQARSTGGLRIEVAFPAPPPRG